MKKKYQDTIIIYGYECFTDSQGRVVKAVTQDNEPVYPYRYKKALGGYYNASGYYKPDYIRKMLKSDDIIFR